MTNSIRRCLKIIAGVSLMASAAFSASFFVPSDRAMIERADVIVVATAQQSFTRISSYGGIETVTPIDVEETIKGDLRGDAAVHEPGGTLGTTTRFIPGVPHFNAGDRVILFLTRTPQQTWAVTDLVLGKFRLEMGRSGHTLALRDAGEIVGWNPDGSVHNEPRRVASEFLSYIRGTVRGEKPDANYFLPATLSSAPESTTGGGLVPSPLVTYTPTSYTSDLGNGLGGRWTVFPNAVTFFSGATQEPGAPGGGTTAVTTGIASWDNDCGSNVNYVYGGTDSTHTSGLTAPDGVNTVLFERNLSAYGVPPFSCSANGYSGTLGIGGITNASGTHSYAGATFYTTQEGDVEMNQGIANCTLLFSNGDFNSAVTHELGHTLGFRHSDQTRADNPSIACTSDPSLECSNTAIMKSFIPTGLNAQLQQWDVNAVRGVYAGGSCTTPPPTKKVRYDLNGDLKADIFWYNTQSGSTAVWLMNGPTIGTDVVGHTAPAPWVPVGVGDFDGDAKADILWRNTQTGENSIWFMNGPTMVLGAYTTALGLGWKVGGIGDFDGDGKDDIFWVSPSDGQRLMWLMSGTAVRVSASLPSGATRWQAAGVGDFNGDGKADIFWYSPSNGETSVWLMNGTTMLSAALSPTIPDSNWAVAGIGDFDGDGKDDVLWRRKSDGADMMWFMNGLQPSRTAYMETIPTQWSVVEVGDFNGDGKADILLRDTSGNNSMALMSGEIKLLGTYITGTPLGWVVVK